MSVLQSSLDIVGGVDRGRERREAAGETCVLAMDLGEMVDTSEA